MAVNMREVANIANVSVSTVSAVLSGKKYVSPLLRMRVEKAANQLGYDRYKVRSHMISEPEKEVGLILPGIYSSYFQPLLSGVEDVAGKEDYNVILCDSNRSWEKECAALDRLVQRGVRNIVLDTVCSQSDEKAYYEEVLLPLVRKRDIRLCLLSRESMYEEIWSFSIDHYGASYAATDYLIKQGRRKIVHISGDPAFPHAALRIQAYRMALLDSGLPFDERYLLKGNFTPISGYAAMQEFLDKGIETDAVFSANDQMAVGAMKAIGLAGLRIPEEIAVVGFDDLSVSSLISPSLTTVHYPIYQIGYGVMRNIVDSREGKPVNPRVRMSTRLVIRRSSDATKQDDWQLNLW